MAASEGGDDDTVSYMRFGTEENVAITRWLPAALRKQYVEHRSRFYLVSLGLVVTVVVAVAVLVTFGMFRIFMWLASG